MAWYFQYTPNESWDYDEQGVHLLFDAEVNGEMRKVVSHFGRNGFVYSIDRTNGQFIAGAQYASKLNWTAGIDPKTGKPVEYDPSKELQTYAIGAPEGRRAQGEVQTCPSIGGGVNYEPTSHSKRTGLIYGAGVEEGCVTILAEAQEGPENGGFAGGRNTGRERSLGALTAVDPANAQTTVQHMFEYPARTGVLTTSGGLAFTATSDGTVYAMNDETLEPLWTFNVGSYLQAPPMTFAVDGKQYIAILSGGGSILRNYMAKSPEVADMQNTSMVWVFGL
jgi:alcohol dehydrogenase (cytochrome c)